MKLAKKLLRAATLATIITASTSCAFAQTNIVTLDENGNGFFNGRPLFFTNSPEPLSGTVTLHYQLPLGTNFVGDVVMLEPQTSGTISDIVRFGFGSVWFFSEREATDVPPFDLADVPQLPMVNTNSFVFIDEIGAEGLNRAVYTPLPGQPGYVLGLDGLTYVFISDVPEPSVCILVGLGALLLAMRARSTRR